MEEAYKFRESEASRGVSSNAASAMAKEKDWAPIKHLPVSDLAQLINADMKDLKDWGLGQRDEVEAPVVPLAMRLFKCCKRANISIRDACLIFYLEIRQNLDFHHQTTNDHSVPSGFDRDLWNELVDAAKEWFEVLDPIPSLG